MMVYAPAHLDKGDSISVLDYGHVQLLDWMGDDLAIVQAAQASFAKESAEYGSREERILNFLMREEHGVPFEHAVIKLRLRLPLKVAAQLKKHRMSSWSEQSSRYDEMAQDCYLPDEFRTQVGKIGSYTFAPVDPRLNRWAQRRLARAYKRSLRTYRRMLARGIAKEQASLILPVGLYTEVVWTLNLRSLFNVLRLRADSHAQEEVRQYAHAIEVLASSIFPDTIRLFTENGRPKP